MGVSSASKFKARRKERATPANQTPSAPARSTAYRATGMLALLVAGFMAVHCLLPLNTAVKIGADEGYELAKATLLVHGYQFYTQVWDDQPPVYAHLLALIIKNFSGAVLWSRLLTVGFAVVLLSGLYLAAYRVHGLAVASLATLLLMAAPGFIELSSSAMQEIPALAPVALALGMLLSFRSRWHVIEALAGMAFAIGLQTKLIGIIYLPVAALILWLRCEPGKTDRREDDGLFRSWFPVSFRNSALVFAGSLAVVFVGVDWMIDRGAYLKHFQQSWSAHFAAPRTSEYGSPAEHPFEWSVLVKNWDAVVPALIGIILLVRQAGRRLLLLVPVVWLALTVAVFGIHKPWWSYYYVHNSVPLSWCAAAGVAGLWQAISIRRKTGFAWLLSILCVCMAAWMAARVWLQVRGIRQSPQLYTDLALPEMRRLKPFTEIIYTDESIYSFHIGIPLPPQLGVISLKRFWSGDMSTGQFVEILRAAKPGLMLLQNSTQELSFGDLLNSEYRLIYEDSTHRLYARNSVLALARQSGVKP